METKILEELRRIKLLTNYNNRLTLNENLNKIDDVWVLKEQKGALKTALTKDAGKLFGAGKFRNILVKDIEGVLSKIKGGVMDTKGVALKTGDDVVRAIESGTLAAAEIGKVNMNLFKTTTNDAIKSAVAKDIVKTNSFTKAMKSVEDEKSAITRLVNGEKKLTQEQAELLVKEYKQGGGSFGKTITQGTHEVQATIPSGTRKKFTDWVKKAYGNTWGRMTRTQKVLAIAGSGLGVYLLWNYFKSEDPGVFPDCVLSFVTDQDLKTMAAKNFGDGVIISNVPGLGKHLNAVGGVKVFTNGKVESVSGNIKGTWNNDGTSINVVIDGQTYPIPCGSDKIEDEDKNDGETGESKWKFCPGPKFELYCKNDTYIKPVQRCLGGDLKVDGYLGPKTQTALKNAGVSLPLTQDGIDKVCKNSQSVTPPKPEVQTPEQQFGTSGNINLVGGTGGQSGAQEIEVDINDPMF